MIKRKYKVVEEKRPTDDFTRWIPMIAKAIDKTGKIIKEDELIWENLPYGEIYDKGYVDSKEKAEACINRYEINRKESEGAFKINEYFYNPK